jgi:hypothetical protein
VGALEAASSAFNASSGALGLKMNHTFGDQQVALDVAREADLITAYQVSRAGGGYRHHPTWCFWRPT